MRTRKISEKTASLLMASNEARIDYINKAMFISYDKANGILTEMEEILNHPKINRMPNILIIARSDNGKTEILREFLKRHPAEERRQLDAIYAPVVYLQSPPGPSEDVFLSSALRMLGVDVRQNDSPDKKLVQLLGVLRRIDTKIILIDELNALLAGSVTKQRFFLNMLKYISNDLQISVVAAGTKDALYAVATDEQIESRFPTRILPRWQENNDFKRLLMSFEYVLPLKHESEIYKGEISRKLYGLSDGVIGGVSTILKSAAKYAIESWVEKITMEVLANCDRHGEQNIDLI
jgi:hypothetical protein